MATVSTTISAKTRIKQTITTALGDGFLSDYYDIDGGAAYITDSDSVSSTKGWCTGESFTCSDTGILRLAKFYIEKIGSPTGNIKAKLYEGSSNFGYDCIPVGEALAKSLNNDVSTISDSSFELVSFDFSQSKYQMVQGERYCIVVEFTSGDNDNYVRVGESYPYGPYEMGNVYSGTDYDWHVSNSADIFFFIYQETGAISAKLSVKNSVIPSQEETIDSYNVSNYSYIRYLSSNRALSTAQSFNSDVDCFLSGCTFYVKKAAGLTGSIVAKLYAHSGTYGVSSVPTGDALAVSDTLDVEKGVSTSMNYAEFVFPSKYPLTANTGYCISIEYSGGDYDNYISVGMDGTSPTHDGNSSYVYYDDDKAWIISNTRDLVFYVSGLIGSLSAKVSILNETIVEQETTLTAKINIKNTTNIGENWVTYYQHSNRDARHYLSSEEKIKISQSFTALYGGFITSCSFRLSCSGSPTGNMVAKLYSHSGTYGISSVPTGEPLAVSNPVDASTIDSAFWTSKNFTFSSYNQFEFLQGERYCIALEYSGGDYNNDVEVGYDASSPTHSGNSSYVNHGSSTWVSSSNDYIFYVYYSTGLGAKVNIFNVVNKTLTVKTAVKQLNVTKTSEAKVKVAYTTETTATSNVNIKNYRTKTISSKTDIKKAISRIVSAKVDVFGTLSTEMSAKVKIEPRDFSTISAKVSIFKTKEYDELDARIRILITHGKNMSVKTYVVINVTNIVTAKIAIKKAITRTQTSKVRTKKVNNTKTLSAKVIIYKKYKLVKYSHFIGSHTDGSIYTNTTSYYPATQVDGSPWLYNADHFNTQTLYFEFDITLLTGVTSAIVRLYDVTDGVALTESTVPVSTSGSYRTNAIDLTSLHEYIAQVKISGGSGYVRVCRPRIFILQEDNHITKTESYFPVSSAATGFTTTSYQTLYPSGTYGSDYNGGVFVYNASGWNGTVEFYLESHFGSTEARTNYIQLYDITSNEVVLDSEITSIGNATRKRSQSFTLEDGKYYAIQTKSSSADETATCGEVRLIAYQNTLGEPEKTVTKTITFYDLRLSTAELTVSNTSYASISTLDSGNTTDFGFNFDFVNDYESFSFYPKLFVAGRMATNSTGTYSFKVYDPENTRDVTLGLSSVFPYQSKDFDIDATDGSVLQGAYQRFELYGHKEVGDSDAVISLYGIYMGVQLKTRNIDAYSKVRISIDEDDLNTATEATIRRITGRLLIKWNGADWVDESQYLVSAKGNSQFSGRKGEIIADQCDFELDNVNQRFLKDNVNSEISNYIKPSIEVKFAVGINGYYTYLFTGRITSVDPDRKSGIVNLSCTDNTALLINVLSPTTLYTSKRFNEIIEILAEHCGIEAPNYSLEESYNIAETVWFEDNTVNDVLTSIVEAERGRLFFDASGNLVFWNKRHFTNQQPVASLSKNLWILNFHSKVDEQEIVNKITITSKPRKPQGVQVVWSNGNAVASDQYNDTLVWIPAESYQNALIELDDPAIDWITPVSDYDFKANSSADGSGTDLTSNITVDEFTTYEKEVFLTVTNHGTTDAFLTEFNIRANPLTVYKWIRTIYTDSASIAKYGTKDITIENNWITSDELANEIKESEINANKESTNTYDLDIIGRPDITAGELISVETKDNYYTVFQVKQNDWTVDSNGYTQKLELAEKEAVTTEYEESYGIGSGIIGEGVVGRSAISRAKSKSVSAKVSIKRNISLTATARVRITT